MMKIFLYVPFLFASVTVLVQYSPKPMPGDDTTKFQGKNLPEITVVGRGSKSDYQQMPEIVGTNIYDSNMQRLNSKQGQNEKQGQGENYSAKQTSKNESAKQSDADDSDEMPKASNKRRKKQSNSIS